MSDAKETDPGQAPPRWVVKAMTRVHLLLNRLTGGKGFNKLGQDEVCWVHMTGAKSGKALTIPLMWVPHEQGCLLVASQGGAPTHPAWYYNIKKNPDIEVVHRDDRFVLRARLADASEKASLWPVCDSFYAPFADYRRRTTRDIPMFVCEPR